MQCLTMTVRHLLALAILVTAAFWWLDDSPTPSFPPNTIPTTSPLIVPDIELVDSYRTSQLEYVGERSVPGKHVSYRYVGPNAPDLVIVVGINGELAKPTLRLQLEDKIKYAKLHGYGLYVRYLQDSAPTGVPASDVLGVAKFGLVRQVFEVFPKCKWALSMDANSYITNMSVPAHERVSPSALDRDALREAPVCSSQTHIRTFRHARVRSASLVVSRNEEGLSTDWFYVRNTLYARALLEFGQDPLNQQYAEFHRDARSPSRMLTHIVTWHPWFLAHVALLREKVWVPGAFCWYGDVREGRRLEQRG